MNTDANTNVMPTLDPITAHAVQDEKKAEKDKLRVLRRIARPPVYDPRFYAMSPEKRAYMKRFGSRPKKVNNP